MATTFQYAERFQNRADVEAYERGEYARDSYSSLIWRLQQPVLTDVLMRQRAELGHLLKALDFACGTGRVLSVLEPLAGSAEGVDISPEMIAVARSKCPQATLRVGNILAEPNLIRDGYDVITAFRFLLNVEPGIRREALKRLRQAIRDRKGLLITNVHGNARSLRHPAIVWRRWRNRSQAGSAMLNEMAPAEARGLLRECGFEVVRQYGFGMLPPMFYRTPLRTLAHAIDRALAGDRRCKDWSIDLLFVCRPI